MGFPGQLNQVLTNLHVSLPTTISHLPGQSTQKSRESCEVLGKDRVVNVVQGKQPHGAFCVTMYFEQAD